MRIAFDFDGVLCLTPFGRFAVHAPGHVPDLPADYEALYTPREVHPLRLAVEYLRFAWRPAAPGAIDLVRELAARHELHIVTGRSATGEPLLRRWLRRHAIEGAFKSIRMAPEGLKSAQHKLAIARIVGIDAHIDDDPRTAYYLAAHGVPRVYLYDHAGAHGSATLPAHLTLVRSLNEFRDHVLAGGA
ncbi:MAG TPA: hypothetical protein VEZ14_12020 [Dehalococcoidia bacterium]|nr:hypothetical protein [Dehalococcoidia bacterium]